jgi:uncharacterized membrane protein
VIVRESSGTTHIENRWLVALAVLAVFLVLTLLSGRVKTFPVWVPCTLMVAFFGSELALRFATVKTMWLRIEKFVTVTFVLVAGVALMVNLGYVLRQMVHGSNRLSSLTLLESSIAVWVTNLLLFSLVYWRMDRGGPEARANHIDTKPDWLFPQEGAPDKAPTDWRPTFVDYLFLAFSTATAFSSTDVLPITSRAKSLMMIESVVSLVTLIAVVARAINTLGT